MGVLTIKGPQEINAEYEVKDLLLIKNMIDSLRSSTKEKEHIDNDIVGIWKDRFNQNVNSSDIQSELREKVWKRY
jgi:hypothetical protein